MINCIIKLAHCLTQSHMPVILTSLPFQPLCTGKRTPAQPVLPGLSRIDNAVHGIKKLQLNTQITEDFA